MSSSSDSELELGQRSQPKVKTATVIQSDEASTKKPRTPWDLMKSKSNKSFSKNYLQGMINKSLTVSNMQNPSQANANNTPKPSTTSKVESDTSSSDEKEIINTPCQKSTTLIGSASKTKKVSFSGKVQEKDIEDVKSVEPSVKDDHDLQKASSQETSKDIDMKLLDLSDSDDEIDSEPKQDKSDSDDSSEKDILISQEKTKKKASTRGAKKRNKFNSDDSANKNRSKFTITAQNEKKKYSFSSDMEDSSSSLSEEVAKKLHSKNQFKNATITNKKPNIKSTSSNSHPPKNLKDVKKIELLKSITQNNTSSSENSGTESTSSSDNEKSASKLKNIRKSTSPSKKVVNKPTSINSKYNIEESSSSSEIPEKQAKNTSSNSINKRLSNPIKELKKRNIHVDKESKDCESGTSSKPEVASSGEEFVNSKLSRNSSLNKSSSSNKRSSLNKYSPTKSTKLKFNNSKPDSSGSDSDTTSHYKTKNEHLHTKLDTYSTLNNLKKITLTTYNLSKDLKNNDTEIYIAQIPKEVSPRLLADKLVFFDKPTVLDIENSTYTLNVKMDENMSRVILASTSKIDDNYFDLSSIKPTGILSVCRENKLKEKSLKIHKEPTEEIIEEPKNLKQQHLLLGRDYADRAKLDKWISDKLEGLITSFNKKHKEKKSKRKSSEKHVKNREEEVDIFALIDKQTEQKSLEENDDSYVNKKKKKKRKSNHHEEGTTAEKSEMQESIDIINQLMLESELPYEEKSSRKHKKEKRQRSKSIFEEDAPISEEEIVPSKRKRSKSLTVELTEKKLENDSLTSVKVSKKNKKAKLTLRNIEEFALSDISSNKQRKGIVNSTMLSSATGSTSIFDQDKSAIPKDDDLSLSSFIDDLLSDMDVKTKKKKRKRKESGDEDTFLEEKRKKKNKVFL